LTEPEAVKDLAATIAADTPELAALIHCAGTILHGSFADTGPEELTRQFTTNVRGTYLLTQLLLPRLSDNPSIVVLNSTQGLRASADTAPFAASMHALRALTDALRDEVNERGIRVTSVYPGRTATPRQEDLYSRKGSQYRPELLLQPDDIAAVVSTVVQLPATAEVTDIHIRPAIKSY
jgi:NAD(P)-dependent dehydrogenase (short-subunit alcohol dehydrogenase family)